MIYNNQLPIDAMAWKQQFVSGLGEFALQDIVNELDDPLEEGIDFYKATAAKITSCYKIFVNSDYSEELDYAEYKAQYESFYGEDIDVNEDEYYGAINQTATASLYESLVGLSLCTSCLKSVKQKDVLIAFLLGTDPSLSSQDS